MTPTDMAVAIVKASGTASSDRTIVNLIVRNTTLQFRNGLIDSHAVAKAFVTRRNQLTTLKCDPEQTKDYIMYLFRETKGNVCRHADGHHYRFHEAKECSPDCDVKYGQKKAHVLRQMSDCCMMETLTTGLCPMGCDE